MSPGQAWGKRRGNQKSDTGHDGHRTKCGRLSRCPQMSSASDSSGGRSHTKRTSAAQTVVKPRNLPASVSHRSTPHHQESEKQQSHLAYQHPGSTSKPGRPGGSMTDQRAPLESGHPALEGPHKEVNSTISQRLDCGRDEQPICAVAFSRSKTSERDDRLGSNFHGGGGSGAADHS